MSVDGYMSVIENITNDTEFLRSQDDHLIIDMMFMTLVMTAVSLKHEGFKEEKEWRVIYLPDLYPSKLMQSDIETVGGVPQKVFKIPLKDNPPLFLFFETFVLCSLHLG